MNTSSEIESRGFATLLPTDALLPTEEFNEQRVAEVLKMLLDSKIWMSTIAVHDDPHVVMDGHHRLEAAKRLGLRSVPCTLLSYEQVTVESRRPEIYVSPQEIILRGIGRNLYPEKTTKHVFPSTVLDCRVPIQFLLNHIINSDS